MRYRPPEKRKARVRRLNVRRMQDESFREKYINETKGATIKRDLRMTVKFFASQMDLPQKTLKTLLEDIKYLDLRKGTRTHDKYDAFEKIAERIGNLPGVWKMDEQREGQFYYIDDYMDASGRVKQNWKKRNKWDFNYDIDKQSDDFRTDAQFNADKSIIAVLDKMSQYPDILLFDNVAEGVPVYVLNLVSILQQYVPFDLFEYMFESVELDFGISTSDMMFYTVRFTKRFKEIMAMWNKGTLPRKFNKFFRKLKNIL